MNDPRYTIGLDFGTNTVRALLVRTADGNEAGTGVAPYPSGEEGILLDPARPHLARQHPGDYLEALVAAVHGACEQAHSCDPSFREHRVAALGTAATSSSPLPVDAANQALSQQEAFRGNLDAQCWLWKDHTSHEEALALTARARELRPHYLERCGGSYSSEWFWSKILHCARHIPEVFTAAYSWVELADWVPSQLAGINDPTRIVRSVCGAGHKALYAEKWGGLPDPEFLGGLHPDLPALRDRLYERAHDLSSPAGVLHPEWAERLGLPPGIPLTVGQIDVHNGAIGCGVRPGRLVRVIGTSSCDTTVIPPAEEEPHLEGISGYVRGSILPGLYGVEAGQTAVGDVFGWWAGVASGEGPRDHAGLAAEAARFRPGETGLLALDWNNGNRDPLSDPRLSGLLLGQSLQTSAAEIYRACLESVAMTGRMILEAIEAGGVRIDEVVCTGGVAEKSPLFLQIYADLTGRELSLAPSSQSVALGGALAAAVLAGAHPDLPTAQEAMLRPARARFHPDPGHTRTYERLYAHHQALVRAFGYPGTAPDLYPVMKDLLALKEGVRRGEG
jgi:L-ribulokinase